MAERDYLSGGRASRLPLGRILAYGSPWYRSTDPGGGNRDLSLAISSRYRYLEESGGLSADAEMKHPDSKPLVLMVWLAMLGLASPLFGQTWAIPGDLDRDAVLRHRHRVPAPIVMSLRWWHAGPSAASRGHSVDWRIFRRNLGGRDPPGLRRRCRSPRPRETPASPADLRRYER
jgi:hypothetical protein